MFLLALLLAAAAPGPVCNATWHDAARNRDVPVRIRMPAGTGKAPVVLFSHGLGGNLDAGTDWAEAWADAGILVVHLQHPGSDQAIWAGGRPAILAAMAPEQLLARIGDVRFVLDHLAQHGREGLCDLNRADMDHVGMSGHSFGAITTQAIAGQRYGTRSAGDPRVKAAIAFSPSPGRAANGSDAQSFGAIAIPFFSLTGSDDAVPQLTDTTPADRLRPFRAMPPGGKYLLWLDGTTHAAFGGNDYAPRGTAPDTHVKPIIKRLTTDFWRWTLLGDAAAKADLDRGSALLGPTDRLEAR